MGRVHLFEFEDQKWFPDFLRNYGTDFLQFLSNKVKIYKPAVPILQKGLEKSNTNTIIDLGSGGGGGWLWLNEELKKTNPDIKIVLTDYYPNIPAFKTTAALADNFEYISDAVDARDVPENLKGLRTQFLSLHHFRPKDALLILQNAVDSESSIGIFEAQERSIPSVLAMIFSPLSVLFTTPFIKPFKWGRLLFTYIIPIVPLFVLWDGIVSCFRTYSIKEMNGLIDQLQRKENFEWEVGRIKSGPGVVLYLLAAKK
ncbi:hypothetical protein [Maribacter sp. 2210JD10-5]|uniref:hypothetical protein n=1 Tax=Maribacter sp. 2210JD10-5 TaxID=3386272 RepID=UPI0039BCB6F8